MPTDRTSPNGPSDCVCGRGIEWLDGHAAFCNLPTITQRDGLKVGDFIVIGPYRWPAVVEGFTTLPSDVIVRWTGKRPSYWLDTETLCRMELAANEWSIEVTNAVA